MAATNSFKELFKSGRVVPKRLYEEISNLVAGAMDTIGDGDTDSTKVEGFVTSRNAADSSMYVPVAASSGYERLWKIAGSVTSNNGGYFEALYANAKVPAGATPGGTVRGSESKMTVEGNMAASAEAHGALGKVNVAGTAGQVDTAIGVESLIETESSGTINQAYGFLADTGTAMSATTAAAYGIRDTTGGLWDYGLDANGVTFNTSGVEIRGRNAETISNETNGKWDFGSANLQTTGRVIAPKINDTDTDTLQLVGEVTTRNAADSSMYVPVTASSGHERGMKVAYSLDGANDGGYFEALYVNARANAATITGPVRAIEAKTTVNADLAAGAEAVGTYNKITAANGSEVASAVGVDVLFEETGTGAITSGTGIRVNSATGAMDYALDVSGDYRAGAIKMPLKSSSAVTDEALAADFGVAEGAATDARFMGFKKDTGDGNKMYPVYLIEGQYYIGTALTAAS